MLDRRIKSPLFLYLEFGKVVFIELNELIYKTKEITRIYIDKNLLISS